MNRAATQKQHLHGDTEKSKNLLKHGGTRKRRKQGRLGHWTRPIILIRKNLTTEMRSAEDAEA
jgi:hypothetical protein